MHWNIDRQGRVIGENAASDADQDIAMSLAFAHAKWGSNTTLDYLGQSKKMINNMMKFQVEAKTFVLKPGDVWGGSSTTNPSYFMPAWYRIFASLVNDDRWNQVVESSYIIADNFNKKNKGKILLIHLKLISNYYLYRNWISPRLV